ncbi:MAG: LexA family transcriptional regulator [Alphaproteobacteria bacterium]
MAKISHHTIWDAIDRLADRYNMSVSGLARAAGLDATAFNKSKRVASDGRTRWPSTESLAKVLEATGATLDDFVTLVGGSPPAPTRQRVPLIGFAQAGAGGYFDDGGFAIRAGWDEIEFPDPSLEHAYALEISGDSMEPVYRDGDMIIVSPGASLRRGDRVVAKTTGGEVMAKVLGRRTATSVELLSINQDHPPRQFEATEITWLARIIWSSQ